MTEQIPDDDATAGRNPQEPPSRAPRGLERLATNGLKAKADDSRLGDLSEQYVRTYERARAVLGGSPLAMALSRLAAAVRYLFSTANVMLFAQPTDPVRQLAAASANETIALDAKERAMTVLHTGARKLVLLALLLVGAAFLISGAVYVLAAWRETEALIIDLEREEALVASIRIENFVDNIERQIGWTLLPQGTSGGDPIEAWRWNYLKLLRQVKDITEATYIDAQGREQVLESRLRRAVYGSGKDLRDDPRFKVAIKEGIYFSPVNFRKETEPYMTIAVRAMPPVTGITAVDVNLKFMWAVISSIHVGKSGFAYVVDREGRLIAHPDISLVLQKTNLSSLPQVRAALPREGAATSGPSILGEPRDLAGNRVTTASARIESLGWTVFVEMPAAEAQAPLWTALIRVVSLLALGLLAIFLAAVVAARRDVPAQTVGT